MYIEIGTYTFADTGFNAMISDYFDYIYTEYKDRLEVARNKELFGLTPICPYYNKVNDFNYLLGYLMLIWHQKNYDTLNARGYDNQYYWTTYSLDDVRHYFQCQGYNIIPLIEIFGLGL